MFHLLRILNYKFFASKFFCNVSASWICLLLPQDIFFILRVWYWKPEVAFKELYSRRPSSLKNFFRCDTFPNLGRESHNEASSCTRCSHRGKKLSAQRDRLGDKSMGSWSNCLARFSWNRRRAVSGPINRRWTVRSLAS